MTRSCAAPDRHTGWEEKTSEHAFWGSFILSRHLARICGRTLKSVDWNVDDPELCRPRPAHRMGGRMKESRAPPVS